MVSLETQSHLEIVSRQYFYSSDVGLEGFGIVSRHDIHQDRLVTTQMVPLQVFPRFFIKSYRGQMNS